MPSAVNSVLNVLGRAFLVAIFFFSAVGNKIPNFEAIAGFMDKAGVPAPKFMLVAAIVFLIVGSLSILVGYKAKFGALLLFTFLVLATYFFHNFWALEGQAAHDQQIQFFKNLGLMGAMLMIMANGVGVASIDACRACRKSEPAIEKK
jgi:putative oxidoreductase